MFAATINFASLTGTVLLLFRC